MTAREIEALFGMLLFSLKLERKGESKRMPVFGYSYPFSFTVKKAVRAMGHMQIDVDNGENTTTTMTCEIEPGKAMQCLQFFMNARLLHCPRSRTLARPLPTTVLQPTAKGVHFFQRYCVVSGINDSYTREMFSSEYASMQCIPLVRDPLTDAVATSEMFLRVLFRRLLGDAPNVYDHQNPPEPISIGREAASGMGSAAGGVLHEIALKSPISDRFTAAGTPKRTVVSPYFHCYFTNPHSDSLSQYYVSTHGMRLARAVEFQGPDGPVVHEQAFTGKAMVQWLLECTDVLYPFEAHRLATQFLQLGYIAPVTLKPSTSTNGPLCTSRDDFYVVTDAGLRVSLWNVDARRDSLASSRISSDSSEPTTDGQRDNERDQSLQPEPQKQHPPPKSAPLSLHHVMADPGYRLLFQEYLEDNYCAENLAFYTETERLAHAIRNLTAKQHRWTKDTLTRNGSGVFSAVCAIYSRYLAPRAPFELNVDENLKTQISRVLDKYSCAQTDREAFDLVSDVFPLLERAKSLVFDMMAKDSLQKFLASPIYAQALGVAC